MEDSSYEKDPSEYTASEWQKIQRKKAYEAQKKEAKALKDEQKQLEKKAQQEAKKQKAMELLQGLKKAKDLTPKD